MEEEESGDFRGGGGGGGGLNSFCKTQRGQQRLCTQQTCQGQQVEINWSDLHRGWFYIFELGQSILLGVIVIQHKPARRSV